MLKWIVLIVGFVAVLIYPSMWVVIPALAIFLLADVTEAHEKDKRKRNPEYY